MRVVHEGVVKLYDADVLFGMSPAMLASSAFRLDPVVMYLVVDVESHSINEEVASIMMQRFCLALMFNRRTVFAVDVQDDFAVKDVA